MAGGVDDLVGQGPIGKDAEDVRLQALCRAAALLSPRLVSRSRDGKEEPAPIGKTESRGAAGGISMATMRAVRAHARGGPEQLRLDQAPRPEPRAGEALIRVHAAGITPTELEWDESWVDGSGHDRTPTIPSHEFSGVVEAVGYGVTHVTVGENVFGMVPFDRNGAAAEFVAIRARDLAPKPASLDHLHAAALSMSALTAWQALTEQAHVRPGNHVLVHGGAGGVGALAVQLAKHLGATVSATASAGDIAYVRSLGADLVVDYRTTPFEQVVRRVDVVLDHIGGTTAEASIAILNDGGSLISLAAPTEVTLPEGRGLSARYFIVEPDRAQLKELARLVDEGKLRVEVAEVFALEAAAEAYRYGHRRGKVVLQLVEAAVGHPSASSPPAAKAGVNNAVHPSNAGLSARQLAIEAKHDSIPGGQSKAASGCPGQGDGIGRNWNGGGSHGVRWAIPGLAS